MAISKIIYKSSASATPETWMDATPATATAEDIASSKTAMLANGVMTTGTGSGGAVTEGDVNFIDYDGTLIASKTKAEINAMTSDSDLPANPTHTGLTAQGWNWTVAQLKAQLTAMPDQPVWVGQMYITTSGATEIDVDLDESDHLSPYLWLCVNGTVVIDWGDNTNTDTLTGTSISTAISQQHTYSSVGKYTIKISATSGQFAFYGESDSVCILFVGNDLSNRNEKNYTYSSKIEHIKFGSGIDMTKSMHDNCFSLRWITIPSGITGFKNGAFYNCYNLCCVIIPNTFTMIGTSSDTGFNTFSNCGISIVSLPYTITRIGESFSGCYALRCITIPNSVTSFATSTFLYCNSLTKIIVPSGITTIKNQFLRQARGVSSVTFLGNITSIGNYSLYALYGVEKIVLSNTLSTIGSYALASLPSMRELTIPANVTSIGSNAFDSNNYMNEYHLLPTAPPTLGTNAFRNIASDCVIYVPRSENQAVLNEYKTATNWSTYASYMQEEPAS